MKRPTLALIPFVAAVLFCSGCAADAEQPDQNTGHVSSAYRWWRIAHIDYKAGWERAILMDSGGYPVCEYIGPIISHPFCDEGAGGQIP